MEKEAMENHSKDWAGLNADAMEAIQNGQYNSDFQMGGKEVWHITSYLKFVVPANLASPKSKKRQTKRAHRGAHKEDKGKDKDKGDQEGEDKDKDKDKEQDKGGPCIGCGNTTTDVCGKCTAQFVHDFCAWYGFFVFLLTTTSNCAGKGRK